MGNYCNGTATLRGDRNTLELIHVLAGRLYDCAAVSGFDSDEDWLPHIFTEEVTDEGIFYEGGGFNKGELELYIRVSRSTGCDFFEAMATGLNLNVTWCYVSDYDDKEYVFEYAPHPERKIIPWKLRTEESLDGDDEDEDDTGDAGQQPYTPQPFSSGLRQPYTPQPFSYGLRQCDLAGSAQGIRPNLSTQKNVIVDTGNTIYTHCLMASTLAAGFRYGNPPAEVVARVAADLYLAGSTLVNLINSEHLVVLIQNQQKFDELRGRCGAMQTYFNSNAFDVTVGTKVRPPVSGRELHELLNIITYVFTNQIKTHPCTVGMAGLHISPDFM